jgi:hypothetical protein
MATATQNLNELCEICQQIFQTTENMFRDGSREAHGKFNSLRVWMLQGIEMFVIGLGNACCHLCALLFHAADDSKLESLAGKELFYSLRVISKSQGALLLSDTISLSIFSKNHSNFSTASFIFREGKL